MSELKQKAHKKLQDEITKEKHPYVDVVGQFLIDYLHDHPEAAEHLLDENKSIVKSLDEMQKVAREHMVGNCAVLTDEQGFEVVLGYFNLDKKAKQKPKAKSKVKRKSGKSKSDESVQQLALEI